MGQGTLEFEPGGPCSPGSPAGPRFPLPGLPGGPRRVLAISARFSAEERRRSVQREAEGPGTWPSAFWTRVSAASSPSVSPSSAVLNTIHSRLPVFFFFYAVISIHYFGENIHSVTHFNSMNRVSAREKRRCPCLAACQVPRQKMIVSQAQGMQLTHPEATSSSELHRIGLRVGLNAVQIHIPDFLVRLPARTPSRDSESDS